MFLMNYLIVHIQEIFIRFLLPHPQSSRIIVSMHVHKPMNGQVIASPFWFASVGNCSSIMTLWKEGVVNKLSGEFCLTEILLQKK